MSDRWITGRATHNDQPCGLCSRCGFAVPNENMESHEKGCWVDAFDDVPHSPGPWSSFEATCNVDPAGFDIEDADGEIVAVGARCQDAKVMAAAPKLLEALRIVYRDGQMTDGAVRKCCRNAIEAAGVNIE